MSNDERDRQPVTPEHEPTAQDTAADGAPMPEAAISETSTSETVPNDADGAGDIAPSGTETPPAADTDAAEEDEDQTSLIDSFTAGGRLKRAREAKGLSVEDMAKRLILNPRVIESLERTVQPPDYDMRRTRIVARSYANALGIPSEPVLADFPAEEEQDLATAIPKSSVTMSERGQGRYMVPAAVVAGLVVAVGVSIMMLTPSGKVAERRATPSVAERVVAVNTAQESLFARKPLDEASVRKIDLSIVALRPAWIEVRGADGTIFRSRTMAREEVYHPRIGAGWTVTVQDGSAFEWRVGDVPVGTLSAEAVPVYSAGIDQAATQAEEHLGPALAATSNSRSSR